MANTDPNKAADAATETQKKAEQADKAAPAKVRLVEDKAPLKVALHLVIQIGADGKPQEVQPGTTFYPAMVDLKFLEAEGAIRDATETERVMHERLVEIQTSADETLG